ncbi:MAG: glycosyltransferase family 87 protein [Caulobacteraceae bacterium]
MLATLRDGAWLTGSRLRNYALLLVAGYAIAITLMVATSSHGVDLAGRPLGTDFSDVWSAGKLALHGSPASAYDPPVQYAMQQTAFGRADIPFYAWLYPPFFLLLAAVLAVVPYLAALALWQAATLPLYLAAVRAILPRRETVLIALAFPAVFLDLTHGQNGFLSAALIGGGLLVLDKRPLLAGVLLGLLAYKPQLGLFIPLVLATSGRWRAFASAAATVGALVMISTIFFGPEIWRAFFAGMTYTRIEVLEQGGTGFHKIQSLFAAIRLWGGPVWMAYAAQAVATAVVGVTLVLLWRSAADFRLKAAALITGALLATPYCLDYDLVLLAPAAAFFLSWSLQRGPRPYEVSWLAFIFVAPIVTREIAKVSHLPLGLAATVGLFLLAVRRGWEKPAASHRSDELLGAVATKA